MRLIRFRPEQGTDMALSADFFLKILFFSKEKKKIDTFLRYTNNYASKKKHKLYCLQCEMKASLVQSKMMSFFTNICAKININNACK